MFKSEFQDIHQLAEVNFPVFVPDFLWIMMGVLEFFLEFVIYYPSDLEQEIERKSQIRLSHFSKQSFSTEQT